MFRWMVVLYAATLAGTASADAIYPIAQIFELSRGDRRALESVACRSFGVELQASFGLDFDDDRRKYDAQARCVRHATIYGHPVVFERWCRYEGGWSCEAETETILAKFPDRRVAITAEGVPLTEAYRIVSHFVLGRLFEPADGMDPFSDVKNPPFDNCRVKAIEGNELELKCQLAHRWVERVRSEGTIRYRQVPLPWCATKDNDACVAEP